MPKRLILDILAFISIIVFPWWVTALILLGIIVFFTTPVEVIALALMADLLYGIPEMRFHGFVFIFTLSTCIALVAVEFLKTRLRFYTI